MLFFKRVIVGLVYGERSVAGIRKEASKLGRRERGVDRGERGDTADEGSELEDVNFGSFFRLRRKEGVEMGKRGRGAECVRGRNEGGGGEGFKYHEDEEEAVQGRQKRLFGFSIKLGEMFSRFHDIT